MQSLDDEIRERKIDDFELYRGVKLDELKDELDPVGLLMLEKLDMNSLRRRAYEKIDRIYDEVSSISKFELKLPENGLSELYEKVITPEREKHLADEIYRIKPNIHIGGAAHIFCTYGKTRMMHELLEDYGMRLKRVLLRDVYKEFPATS